MAHEVSQRRVQTRGKFPVLASGRTSILMPAQSRRAAVTSPPSCGIELRILLVRGQKVLIDADLAELYGVPTKRLNEQVRRNAERFPEDFCFQLTAEESAALR